MHGIKVIFCVGLALLEGRMEGQSKLLKLDMEDKTKHFQKEMKFLSEEGCDALFEDESIFKKTKKDGEKVQSNDGKATNDNYKLEKRVLAIEKECAALADRLIQGQVTRAQEYEEILETDCTSALSLKDTSQQPPPHYWFQLKKEIKNRTHR
uniref:Uncharacterized protein n=1 Tax=Amphimedon queenslandica TaxID=400682 RepID=A0A1X7TY51_AMPQE